jgi:hypothetical protein
MNEITEELYISDEDAVRSLPTDAHQFDEIVTVGYSRLRNEPPAASDTGAEFYFPDGGHDHADFVRAVEYVIDRIENGDCVLVHCQAGISRSGGVCSAVLTETTDMTLEEAFNTVQDSRQIVNPASDIRDSMKRYTGQTILPEYGDDTRFTRQLEETE